MSVEKAVRGENSPIVSGVNSRFPEVPLFGRAAREAVLKLHAERECFPNASPRSPLMYRKLSVCIRRSAALSAVIWRLRLSLTRKQNPSTEQPSRRTGAGVK